MITRTTSHYIVLIQYCYMAQEEEQAMMLMMMQNPPPRTPSDTGSETADYYSRHNEDKERISIHSESEHHGRNRRLSIVDPKGHKVGHVITQMSFAFDVILHFMKPTIYYSI